MVGRLTGGLVGWLVGWLVDWLVGWLVGWLTGGLVGWLVGWLTGGLVGWLVGWLLMSAQTQVSDESAINGISMMHSSKCPLPLFQINLTFFLFLPLSTSSSSFFLSLSQMLPWASLAQSLKR